VTRCVRSPPPRIRSHEARNRLPAEADPDYKRLRAGLPPGHLGNVGRDMSAIEPQELKLTVNGCLSDRHKCWRCPGMDACESRPTAITATACNRLATSVVGNASNDRLIRFLLAIATTLLVTIGADIQVDAISSHGGVIVHEKSATFPTFFVRDVVVSNTDRHLQNTDTFRNSEPGIAINPLHPNQIVISAFSGAWALPDGSPSNSPLWYSKSGGAVWTKVFSIPAPNNVPGVAASPCDQTFDYDRDGNLYGTFLVAPGSPGDCSKLRSTVEEDELGAAIYSGATADPADPAAWKWFLGEGGTAQPSTPATSPDQPWLIAAPDAGDLASDKIYVAYQAGECEGVDRSIDLRVAAAAATVPPNFPLDEHAGCSNPGPNPGHRAAADPRTGAVYTLYGNPISPCATPELLGGIELEYRLNRSTDGGRTWSFGNQPLGTVVAQACSDQSRDYSFGVPEPGNPAGGVNLLKGGIHALAVDPQDGAVYVVYGVFDDDAERDQLKIVRVTSDGGNVEIGSPVLVSNPADRQAALPAVAVTENGTVGVLYDTADGLVDDSDVPTFSAHLAVSRDQGKTFSDAVILHFRSPVPSDAEARILGDYQQLKAVGNTFYGVFSGNGHDLPVPFNRRTEAIDPIFFKTTVR